MSNLFPSVPAFLDLTGRRVVLLWADDAAAALASAFLECGAGVTLFDRHPSAAAQALAPAARLVRRRWRADDLKGAALVAAAPDERSPGRARLAAKTARAMFYMADAPIWSDITIGAVSARGPLAVGVSDRALPDALRAAVRARIEAAAPARLSGFFDASARLSEEAAALIAGPVRLENFWRMALAEAGDADPDDWMVWLADLLAAEVARGA